MQISQNGMNHGSTTQASGANDTKTVASSKALGRVSGLFDPSSLSTAENTDTTAISSTASLLARALATSPPETSQVQQITSSVLNHTYRVDPGVLASTMIETMTQRGVE